MNKMGQGFDAEYLPDPKKVPVYKKRYEQYQKLGNFIELQTHRKDQVEQSELSLQNI
jgi:L-ribulokinase